MSGRITYWVIDTIGVEYAARHAGLIGLASQIIIEVTERGVPDVLGIQALNDD